MADITADIAAIRAAVYGLDVRESIAEGIDAINAESENTVARQDTIDANEATRINDETGRVNAETSRVNVEDIRVASESGRVSAESVRVTDETTRIANETARTAEFSTLTANINTGANLDATLKTDISTGNSLDTTLKSDISTGNTTDTNLKADIAAAGQNSFATEVTNGRGTFPNLKARADNVDSNLAANANQLNSQFVNVMYPPFPLVGAKGNANFLYTDGLYYTDSTHTVLSTDDTSAINNCIQYCQNRGGGTIFFPNNYVFGISNSLIVTGNNISLEGVGKNSQIQYTGRGLYMPLVLFESNWVTVQNFAYTLTNCSIKNIGLRSGGWLTGIGLFLSGVRNFVCENVRIENMQIGYYAENASEVLNNLLYLNGNMYGIILDSDLAKPKALDFLNRGLDFPFSDCSDFTFLQMTNVWCQVASVTLISCGVVKFYGGVIGNCGELVNRSGIRFDTVPPLGLSGEVCGINITARTKGFTRGIAIKDLVFEDYAGIDLIKIDIPISSYSHTCHMNNIAIEGIYIQVYQSDYVNNKLTNVLTIDKNQNATSYIQGTSMTNCSFTPQTTGFRYGIYLIEGSHSLGVTIRNCFPMQAFSNELIQAGTIFSDFTRLEHTEYFTSAWNGSSGTLLPLNWGGATIPAMIHQGAKWHQWTMPQFGGIAGDSVSPSSLSCSWGSLNYLANRMILVSYWVYGNGGRPGEIDILNNSTSWVNGSLTSYLYGETIRALPAPSLSWQRRIFIFNAIVANTETVSLDLYIKTGIATLATDYVAFAGIEIYVSDKIEKSIDLGNINV